MKNSINVSEILKENVTIEQLLSNLKKRVIEANQGKTALERGKAIMEQFPELAADTIGLADEAMKGMLVLPGTGPELYFVGNPPKWEYNPVGDNEYTFHLNRMHHLKTLSEAYSLTGNTDYAKKAIEELTDWIDNIPCPEICDENGNYLKQNFGGLSTWRALEIGIRGYRTWPIIIELLIETPYFDCAFLEKLVCSVYMHCRVLYEVSPLLWPKADHNHYLMENLGLMSLSCLFPEMKNSAEYLAHSQHELDRCMAAQCTSGGGQIEGCPSYHNGCVFWFAMRIVFARKFHVEVPEDYVKQLEKMFEHSVHATRACGGNFPWGDSHIADKETMALAAVSCYMAYADPKYLETALYFYPVSTVMNDIRDNLWRIPDVSMLKHVMDLSIASPKKPELPLVAWQKDLDQAYIRTGWEKDAISFMTACRTPVQNRHAHIDAGGFDLTAFGETLVSDPGIYTYKDCEERKRFKSAFSHNCLTVNHKNMWEYLGAWKYGPQKEGHITSVTEESDMVCVISKHRNYEPAEAIRALAMVDNSFLIVIDQVNGLSVDSAQIHFHLDRTSVKQTSFGMITTAANRPNVELVFDSIMETELEVGKISPVNDIWRDSILVHLNHNMEQSGSFYHASLIIPHEADKQGSCCHSYHTELTENGFLVSFVLNETDYRFLWTGETLTKLPD